MIIAVARRRMVLVQLGCFKHPVTVCLLNPRKFRKSFGHLESRSAMSIRARVVFMGKNTRLAISVSIPEGSAIRWIKRFFNIGLSIGKLADQQKTSKWIGSADLVMANSLVLGILPQVPNRSLSPIV